MVQLTSRSPPEIRKQTENRILEELNAAQAETDEGGLTFKQLVDKTGFSSRTVSDALKRLRKVIDKKLVWMKRERKGKIIEGYNAIYYLTEEFERAYPDFGFSRKHYSKLANRLDYSVEPKGFISEVAEALTKDLVKNLIEAKKARRKLDPDAVRRFLRNFDLLIKNYIFYRKPETAEALKSDPIRFVLKNSPKVDSQPDLFKEQFDELLKACGEEA